MSFDPDTLQPRRPPTAVTEETQPVSRDRGAGGKRRTAGSQKSPQPIQQPQQDEQQPTRTLAEDQVLDAATEHETVVRQQYELGLQTPSDEPHHEVHTGIF